MDDLYSGLDQLWGQINDLLVDHKHDTDEWAMPGDAYFLPNGEVLALPRDSGDSRYPYGHDGFNFWVYASGYMHGNEGLFSSFLRASEGQEPKIAFFAGLPQDNGTYKPIPLLSVPRLRAEDGDSIIRYCVLGPNAAYYITKTPMMRFGMRVFVSPESHLCFSIRIRNISDRRQRFFISSYFNPYLRHRIYEDGEDRWFKEVEALPPSPEQGELGPFRVTVHEDKDRHTTITSTGILRRAVGLDENCRLLRHEETASRNQYVGGIRSSLHTPDALRQGTFGAPQHTCTFVETAIMGDLLEFELETRSQFRVDMIFSFHKDQEEANQMARIPVTPEMICDELSRVKKEERETMAPLNVQVGESTDPRLRPYVFNHFFEHLKKQVEFCSLIKGYVQLSINSLIGIRDVFQALEGLLFWEPEAAKKKMLEALSYTAPYGRCFRQYSLPIAGQSTSRADLRPFIDQGCWVISTIWTYLCATGDRGFLNTLCGYHAIIDEKAGHAEPTRESDSVLQHLLRIMDYLLLQRDRAKTQCVFALYGDWNDALDGLGISSDPTKEYGTGVSVMATLQVYQNTQEMVQLLEGLDPDRYADEIARYRQAGKELEQGLRHYAIEQNAAGEQRILHGWGDGRAYLVGSFNDPDHQPRDGLTSNAFWVLSGLHRKDPGMRDTILKALERLDSKYGYKTFEPAFPKETTGVGRIIKLPPGTAENGASYIHATAFAIMALFQMGEPRRAWDQLIKILPFTDLHENLSHSPYVMPNSYGLNEEKLIDGQNMNDWQTGSSNVVLKILIRFVFGVDPGNHGLWIQPATWSPFRTFDFSILLRGTKLKLHYENQGGSSRHFTLNGTPAESSYDAIMNMNRLWIAHPDLPPGRDLEIGIFDAAS